MRRIHIVNPVAGQGNGAEACKTFTKEGDTVYETVCAGDVSVSAERFCREYPGEELRFYVYGGDGSVSEAVNGICRADAKDRVYLTPVGTGTGNDFVRMFSDENAALTTVDLFRVNDDWAINMFNAGFDADVAGMIADLKKKPFIKGSFAYIVGVVKRLCQKMGREMTVEWEDEAGESHTVHTDILLCAAANAKFCGGGFCAAPAASMQDGLLDLMIVTKVSRLKFISLVGRYHNGTHVTPDGEPVPAFRSCVQYHRCRSIHISGMKLYCRDGEVSDVSDVRMEIIPAVLRVLPASVE